MVFLIALLPLAVLAFMVYCAFKESKVTGVYKAFGVYGRIYAYITMTGMIGGTFALIGMLIGLFQAENIELWAVIGEVITVVALTALGYYMYSVAKRKCPEFLRKKLFISMLITALGVGVKISVFFIGAVWEITKPREVVDSHGNRLYVFNGEVYAPNGDHVGSSSGANEFRPNSNYNPDLD